ncbi:MAG: hypothetical protein ACF8XB_01710 [Planctomycetota bacterium JB042]
MTTDRHDATHEAVREALACGDLAEDAPEVVALREGCPTCRDALDETARSLDELRRAGRAMRDDLAAAERERGAPGEHRIGAMLERARAAAGEPGGTGTAPRLARRTWLAAAAALLFAPLVWWVVRAADDAGRDGPMPLGDGLACERPVGEVDAWGAFVWSGDLPPAGWFEVVVRDEDGAALVRSGRLEENEFRPTEAELRLLTDGIRWEVVARDVGRVHDRAAAEARLR